MTKRPSSIYNDPGYLYNRKLLIRLFTYSSLALVVGIVWWIWDDFDRPWKSDQRDELRWEARRFTVERAVLESLSQEDREKYAKELAAAQAKVDARQAEIAEIDRELKKADGAFTLGDMTYKEQKQYTSEADYRVQEAPTEADLRDWEKRLREDVDREMRYRDMRYMADANVRMLQDRKKALQAEVDAVRAAIRKNPAVKRLEIVDANVAKKRGYNPLREIPLLDFLAAPVAVKQIVLKNLVDNYEFSTPQKVDRCATCHILSTELGYDKARWPVEAVDETKDPAAFEEGVYRFVYSILDSIDPDKPPASDPWARELNLLRKARLHKETLELLFEIGDEDDLSIRMEDRKIGDKVVKMKVWKRYLRDKETGLWKQDPKGRPIADYYNEALHEMKGHWRTHPHYKDMVGGGSPHPYDKFGCSTCHQGRGWSTDFGLAYHVPDLTQIGDWMTDERAHKEGYHLPLAAGQTLEAAMAKGAPPGSEGAGASDVHVGWVPDEATAERWEHEYDRTEAKLHYWHWPQFPKSLVQSSCLKCHREGLYRTAKPEYEGVHFGKPLPGAPDLTEYEDQSAAANPDLDDPHRMLIPAEEETYRPENLERGLRDFVQFGCYGCHKVDASIYPFMRNVRPKVGPPLDQIATKTTKEWALRWVRNPKDFRPDTRMPRFFGLSNNSSDFRYRFSDTGTYDEVNAEAWSNAEIYSIVEWIWEESKSRAPAYPPVDLSKGDPKRGEQYVVADGQASENHAKACIACHDIEAETPDLKFDAGLLGDSFDKASGHPTGWKHRMSRRQGPNLAGIASKVTPEWLVAWLKNPRGYWHDTNMPDLRLADQEALDIAAFLMTKRHTAFEALPGVAFDQAVVDRIARELKVAEQKESTEQAVDFVNRMPPRARVLYVGQKLVKHYGCFGCHQVEAFKDATPIGTELSDWGSKLIDRLAFNHVPIEKTRFSFAYAKMMNPRIYDLGMPTADRPFDRLKMPRFGFRPEEAKDLATYLIGLTSDPVPSASVFQPDEREADIIRGREIVARYNCQGCHVIENEGGDIWPVIAKAKWRPPDLKGQGRKTQPVWLFHFVKDPAFVAIPGVQNSDRVRPWFSIRMPTFHFSDEEVRALVRYFSALSEMPADFESGQPDSLVGPGSDYASAKKFELTRLDDRQKKYVAEAKSRLEETRLMFQEYQCKSCHSAQAPIDNAAPDFRHARAGRLRDTWIVDWLWGPLKLQPGTAMPVFFVDSKGNPRAQDTQFFGGTPDEQIHALRDFVRHHYREEDR
ncbi:MAG TPA: c-type cytochrome [Planctomycetota bacterium]|nr:c-type cytochrome [Planctomycetota bacterium]